VLTAVVVVVIVVAVIFVAQLLSTMLKGDKQKNDFTMPNVVGMDYNYANSLYSNVLVFEIESREYSDADENVIIEQSIPADSEFNKGDTLRVKVSLGQETVEVPDVVNINSDLAVDQLRARNIEFTITKISDPSIAEGYVIKTEPEAGTMIHKNKDFKVVLYVSMGSNANKITVKDYTKKDINDAKAVAEYDMLKVRTEQKNSYEKEGIVVEQSLEVGSEVDEGTEIVLYVSNGVAPDGEIPYTIRFPDGVSGRFVVSFIMRDEEGKTTTVETPNLPAPPLSEYTQSVEGAGEKVSVTVSVTNLNTFANAIIGTYTFDFASGSYTTDSEDFNSAFQAIGAFPALKIPNVVGMNYDSATSMYGDFSFAVDPNWEYSSTVPYNSIIRQYPEAGTETSSGATITVVLSLGPEPQQTTTQEPYVEPTEPETENGGGDEPGENTWE
jgi:serine/threonine-protein kinase